MGRVTEVGLPFKHPMASDPLTRIHVCIPTYRRPAGLRRVLASVARQRLGGGG